MIYIIGLGPNNSSNIKENIKNLLLENKTAKIIARTKEHPAISFLESNNIPFETCDRFYTENENFENTYNSITNYILEQANSQDVMYLVPGHPMVAELTTQLLIKSGKDIKIIGGESFLDSCFNAAKFDPVEGFTLSDATNLDSLKQINPLNHNLITQCYDDLTAANVSDELFAFYPFDHEVTVIEQAGDDNEKIYTSPLNELSATVGEEVNNLRALYIPPLNNISYNIKSYTKEFDENVEITEGDLIQKLELLTKELKDNSEKAEDYTLGNAKILAKIINTALDFTIACDNFYELNDIIINMKEDRNNG